MCVDDADLYYIRVAYLYAFIATVILRILLMHRYSFINLHLCLDI